MLSKMSLRAPTSITWMRRWLVVAVFHLISMLRVLATSFSCPIIDHGVVAGPRVAHEVEGDGVDGLVDGVRKDNARRAARDCPPEGDGETAVDERFVEVL
jgi:hypothetical protein